MIIRPIDQVIHNEVLQFQQDANSISNIKGLENPIIFVNCYIPTQTQKTYIPRLDDIIQYIMITTLTIAILAYNMYICITKIIKDKTITQSYNKCRQTTPVTNRQANLPPYKVEIADCQDGQYTTFLPSSPELKKQYSTIMQNKNVFELSQ